MYESYCLLQTVEDGGSVELDTALYMLGHNLSHPVECQLQGFPVV